jgi:hypothetical protein
LFTGTIRSIDTASFALSPPASGIKAMIFKYFRAGARFMKKPKPIMETDGAELPETGIISIMYGSIHPKANA